ncbi:hypothetical protein IHQ71_28260 [Rhizobium sp. TH2]|uniref:hypothetical protein n=1 Tax=Rhizobium sp. TH2 TaxID=2775403 RepID=UPI00215711E4|nr:hypothetical protein [Rhizobium sp. TH2]UVC08962.1 hypothetical protein IHQ71_28260 [Rhizobium sp. TH2]
MARPKRRRRKAESNFGLIFGTVALGLASVAILGGYGYLKYYRGGSHVAIDKASLCPVDGPKEITAILLDVTDPISPTTATDLRNNFQDTVNTVTVGGLIQVYALTDVTGELKLTFSGCNPGSGEDADIWTSNPRLMQKRWEEGFEKPLKDLADSMDQGVEGKQSPIMAGIQKINLDVFGNPAHKNILKRLVIASDMIEYTKSFSMYATGPDYEKFLKSPARDEYRTSLAGVTVRMLVFQRPGLKFTTREIGEFWGEWVTANKGSWGGYVRLEGIK